MTLPSSAGWWAAALAALAVAVHSAYLQPWTVDDAYIAFRYAENTARGNGPVFNPGERVEGYTDFLWVALLAGLHRLGSDIEAASKVLGLLFAGGTLLLLSRSHRIVPGGAARVSLAATLLLGASGAWTAWVMGGLEVPMVGFWLLLAFLLHARSDARPDDRRLAAAEGVACALAALSRPDCALLFGVLCADRALTDRGRRSARLLPLAAGFAVLWVPYFAWRSWFYGHLLPNTFYAKVGGSTAQAWRGLAYLGRFAEPGLPVALLAAAGLVFRRRLAPAEHSTLPLAAFLAAHLSYVAAVGGDALPAFRFLAHVLPLLCLLAARVLCAAVPDARWLAAALTAAVAWGVFQSATHRDLHLRVVRGDVGRDGRTVGLWLRDRAPPDALLATNTAGSIPYFSKLRTVDMLGLNDEHIAHRDVPDMGSGVPGHEKGDGRYVLSRRPDYIQFGSSRGRRVPSTLGDREIAASPEFQRDYIYREYRLDGGIVLKLYERRASAGGKPIDPSRAP